MNLPAFYIIVLVVMLLIAILRTESGRHLFGKTWFGFLLILGGISFFVSATLHDQVVIMGHGRFSGAVLDRWQMVFLGLFSLGFGIFWIYGPLRRWFKNRYQSDDDAAV